MPSWAATIVPSWAGTTVGGFGSKERRQEMEVSKILDEAGKLAAKELRTPVAIEEVEEFPSLDELYVEKRAWKKIPDVVVVSADLKGSTKLNFNKYAQTSAQLYEAVTGNMVRIVSAFSPEFVDIQGDGLFALYHGDGRYRRALCAAITLKTFSEHKLVPAIEATMPDRFPDTGLKVGMAAGILAAKTCRRQEPRRNRARAQRHRDTNGARRRPVVAIDRARRPRSHARLTAHGPLSGTINPTVRSLAPQSLASCRDRRQGASAAPTLPQR